MPNDKLFNAQERKEFRQMLRDKPELAREYKHFKSESYQELRSRTGHSIWLEQKGIIKRRC